jgi:hypothetical protein
MNLTKNVVGWFEIPVADMDRAIRFYQEVFLLELSRNKFETVEMAWFPWNIDTNIQGSSGSLVYNPEFYKPSVEGTLVYFSSMSDDLNDELGRVESAGGKIIIPKTQISEDIGYMGVFIDSEGNRIALHSRR